MPLNLSYKERSQRKFRDMNKAKERANYWQKEICTEWKFCFHLKKQNKNTPLSYME